MKRTTITRRAAATAVLLFAVGASVAWAHGNTDQMNDPPVQSGWFCAAEGADSLHQGFTPTRRLLSAFDVRVFKRSNFPTAGLTLTGRVHAGTGTSPVLGSSTAFVPYEGPDELLVHFDFNPPVTLEPAGTFVFGLTNDVSGVRWMGRNDNPYANGNAFDCGGFAALPTLDFNFITYVPPDGAPPETTLQAERRPGSPTRSRTASLSFTAADDLSFASNLVVSCELDGDPYDPCASPVSLQGLGDGSHTFSISATDQAGKVDPTPATVSWTVDGTAPAKPLVQGPRRAKRDRVTYHFSSRDVVDRPRQLAFRCSVDSTRLRPCAARVTRRLEKGRHVLRVVAVDRAGNVSRPAVVRIVRV